MDGEIGALYQDGQQVGGIFDWEVTVSKRSADNGDWKDVKVFKDITAKSYWLIDAPASNYYEVKFFKAMRGRLVLLDSGRIEIELPNKSLDRRFYIPLEMRWIGN